MAHVLVVDDDDSFRTLLTEMLESLGHSVSKAADGEEALERVRETSFDLLLLDLVMPRKGGIETLMALASGARRIPVVVTSASIVDDDESVPRLVKRYGARAVLSKPFSREQLAEVLSSIVKE